jgi:hypothetical protein
MKKVGAERCQRVQTAARGLSGLSSSSSCLSSEAPRYRQSAAATSFGNETQSGALH